MIKRKQPVEDSENEDLAEAEDADTGSAVDQYDSLRVGKSFDQKLAELHGQTQPTGDKYLAAERESLSKLLDQYRNAAQKRSDDQARAGAWGLVAGNALGPEAGRAVKDSFMAGTESELDGLNQSQNATKSYIGNESGLLGIARKKALMDPESPLSKAYVDYERKTKGFGENVPGLSAQDTIDASKSTNKVYGEEQNTNRTNIKEAGQDRRLEDKQQHDATQKSLDRGAAQTRVETAGKYGLGRTILGQDQKSASGAAKAGQEAVEGSIGLTEELAPITPGDKNSQFIVPNPKAPPTPQQKTRMRVVSEFAGQGIYALQNLQKALNDPDANRAARFFDLFKRTADATRQQYEAFSKQSDVKLNDNGVLNPADLTIAGQAIFGMDIASLKTIFMSNPELANILNTRIRAIQKQYLDNVSVNSYTRMNPEEAKRLGASNFQSTSQPLYSAPDLMQSLGIERNQPAQSAPQASQPIADPKAAIRARFEQIRREKEGK